MDQSDIDLLQTAPVYHLQSVVKTRQIPVIWKPQNITSPANTPSTSSISSDIPKLAGYLFNAAAIKEVLNELDELEMLILRELVACGGRANSRDLALYFSSSGSLSHKGAGEPAPSYDSPGSPFAASRSYSTGISVQYPVPHPHGIFEQAVRRLLILGLLFWGKQTNFAGRDYTSGIHDGVLIVPQAVKEVVHSTWPPEDGMPSLEEEQNTEAIGDEVRMFQRALYLYWSMVAATREGLPLVSNGLLSRSALRQVVEHMGNGAQGEQVRVESDLPRLFFIRLLLQKLELLRERKGTLHAAPAEAFFALPLLERARRCYRLYLETTFWNELLYLPEVSVRPGPAPLEPAHEEVVHARQLVAERMLQEPPDTWRDISTFIARTKLYVPYLLFPRHYGPRAERYSSGSNPYGWDFRLRRGWLTHREGWHMVEGGFIRSMLMGPLHWLGIVELDRAESPEAFRLTSGAAQVMSNVPIADTEAAWGRLIVQPNFELVALAPVSELLLVTLDRFAERVSLEHIAQYRLSKGSVTRAIQKGLHAEAIQAELERAAGGEIPQNIRYSLVEWERQARRVELWQGVTLLEVDNAELLDDLFAEEETRALFGRRLAPYLAEVALDRFQVVQEILWQRGYLPALTAAPSQDVTPENGRPLQREPQWELTEDGLLRPAHAVLDLYLVAEVERFCERDAVTGWHRITPASLSRALEQGATLERIVRFLQCYCKEGIPSSFLIQLKLWGGGYDEGKSITVERLPLLRLSEQVLQDLRNDQEIKALLGTEVEQQSRLVRVSENDLSRLLELLRKRGFAVE